MDKKITITNPQLTREVLDGIKDRANSIDLASETGRQRVDDLAALIDHVELTKPLTASQLQAIRDRAERLSEKQDRFDVFMLIAHVEKSV